MGKSSQKSKETDIEQQHLLQSTPTPKDKKSKISQAQDTIKQHAPKAALTGASLRTLGNIGKTEGIKEVLGMAPQLTFAAGDTIFRALGAYSAYQGIKDTRAKWNTRHPDTKKRLISTPHMIASVGLDALKFGAAATTGAVSIAAVTVGAAVALPVATAVASTIELGKSTQSLFTTINQRRRLKKQEKALNNKLEKENINLDRDLALFEDLRMANENLDDLNQQRDALMLMRQNIGKDNTEITKQVLKGLSNDITENTILQKSSEKAIVLEDARKEYTQKVQALDEIMDGMSPTDPQYAKLYLERSELNETLDIIHELQDQQNNLDKKMEKSNVKLDKLKEKREMIKADMKDMDKESPEFKSKAKELAVVQKGIKKHQTIIKSSKKTMRLEQQLDLANQQLEQFGKAFTASEFNSNQKLQSLRVDLQVKISHLEEELAIRKNPELSRREKKQEIQALKQDHQKVKGAGLGDDGEVLRAVLDGKIQKLDKQIAHDEHVIESTKTLMRVFKIINPEEQIASLHSKADHAKERLPELEGKKKLSKAEKKEQAELMEILEISDEVKSLEKQKQSLLTQPASAERDSEINSIDDQITKKTVFDARVNKVMDLTSQALDIKNQKKNLKRDIVKQGATLPLATTGAVTTTIIAAAAVAGVTLGATVLAPLAIAAAGVGVIGGAVGIGYAMWKRSKNKKAKTKKDDKLSELEADLSQRTDALFNNEKDNTLDFVNKRNLTHSDVNVNPLHQSEVISGAEAAMDRVNNFYSELNDQHDLEQPPTMNSLHEDALTHNTKGVLTSAAMDKESSKRPRAQEVEVPRVAEVSDSKRKIKV